MSGMKKWIVSYDEGGYMVFKCPICGNYICEYTGEILNEEWKFCPNCGARMERSEE